MTANDTIFALASGPGRSAIAVIRISGRHTSGLLQRICGILPPPRQLVLRTITDPESSEVLDKAMIAWFPGSRSFTGEDSAELHLHGSPAILSGVMGLLSRQAEVRPAEAGEFTRRAFLNGKMDLVEVEGLGDLLDARTAGQRRQAMRQMSGQASAVFDAWRHALLLIRADIEAVIDFADEPGIVEAASQEIDARIRELLEAMDQAVASSSTSEIIRDGVRVVLAGKPNTGKSSLLNKLVRREAAIVSDMPGTTRDAIQLSMDVQGIPVLLTDTAGLRQEASDKVEEEGIRRSRKHMTEADIVLWVWSPDVEGSEIVDTSVEPALLICNKSDLLPKMGLNRNESGGIQISTQSGEGIPGLIAVLSGLLKERFGDVESSLLVSARQKLAVTRSIRHLSDSLLVGPELLEVKAEEIRRASEEIGRLTGRIDVEEWLGAIFSRFCIGK